MYGSGEIHAYMVAGKLCIYGSREILGPETEVELGMALCWLYNLLPDGASWREDC